MVNYLRKHIIGAAVVVVTWLPLFWLLLVSLRKDDEFYQGPLSFLPEYPTITIFHEIFSNTDVYLNALINSFITSFATSVIALTIGTGTAFYFVHSHKVKSFAKNLGIAVIASRFLPVATIVPGIYWLYANLNLLDSLQGLVLIQVISALSLTVLLMSPVLANIHRSHLEKAEIEGAGSWDLFRWVLWPNIRLPLLFVLLINFAVTWNEYFVSNMISETVQSQTISIVIAGGIGQFRVRYSLLAAGGLLSLAPAILITLTLLITNIYSSKLNKQKTKQPVA